MQGKSLKPRRAAVYVDQYTGEVKGLYERPAFFATMLKLHRWLLDSRDDSGGVFWGRTVVAYPPLFLCWCCCRAW